MLQVLILGWKRGVTRWRWRLLPMVIVTVVVHAKFGTKPKKIVVETVQSKTSRPISKSGGEICDGWLPYCFVCGAMLYGYLASEHSLLR